MLKLLTQSRRPSCAGTHRREFLQVGTLGLGALSLPGLLRVRAQAVSAGKGTKDTAVVFLFLTGGASHIETFDPKMTAPAEYRSVTGEVATRLPGVTFGGTFPRLARLADRLAVVHSFSHETSDHTRAVQQVIRGGKSVMHVLLDEEARRRLPLLPGAVAAPVVGARPIASLF